MIPVSSVVAALILTPLLVFFVHRTVRLSHAWADGELYGSLKSEELSEEELQRQYIAWVSSRMSNSELQAGLKGVLAGRKARKDARQRRIDRVREFDEKEGKL